MATETNPPDTPTPKPRKRSRAKKAAITPPEKAASAPVMATTPPPISPVAPVMFKRVWAFINTNSAVLDLMVNTLTFLIVACFGTWLVFKQNNLMENQNALVKQQMSLDEAGRRSALIALMSNIMDKVDDEIKDQKDDLLKQGLSRAALDTMKFSLSQSLIGQIAALSHSFKPYRFLDADTLIDRPLSPERGQLLITLTRLPLDTQTLHRVYSVSTFMYANLSGADLHGAFLIEAGLFGADLSVADLIGADLRGADLIKADLSETSLFKADLRGAFLSEADLSAPDLREADLREADLFGADLNLNKLQTVKTLYNCQNLHDSLSIPLHKTHPHLFEPPKDQKKGHFKRSNHYNQLNITKHLHLHE